MKRSVGAAGGAGICVDGYPPMFHLRPLTKLSIASERLVWRAQTSQTDLRTGFDSKWICTCQQLAPDAHQ